MIQPPRRLEFWPLYDWTSNRYNGTISCETSQPSLTGIAVQRREFVIKARVISQSVVISTTFTDFASTQDLSSPYRRTFTSATRWSPGIVDPHGPSPVALPWPYRSLLQQVWYRDLRVPTIPYSGLLVRLWPTVDNLSLYWFCQHGSAHAYLSLVYIGIQWPTG